MITLIISAIEDDYEREFILNIYNKYYFEMKKRAYRFLRNNEEAEELVQDAFVKLIEHVDVVMTVGDDKLPGYVMSTIKNLAFNKIKKNQRKGNYEFSRDDAELSKWLKDNQALPEDLYQKEEGFRFTIFLVVLLLIFQHIRHSGDSLLTLETAC